MLDPRVTVDDLRTFWKGCIAFYKNEPVLVISVGKGERNEKVAQIKRLKDGSIEKIEIAENNTLVPPDSRLGFVNLNGMVIYTSRTPVRRFMMGINDSNLKASKLVNYFRYERGEIHQLSTSSIEFYRTLKGEYPTLPEALEQVKTFGGVCAFDRQFAVCENRLLYYKTKQVGKVLRGACDLRGLSLNEDKQYLKSVIWNFNYDEAARTLG